MGIQVKGWPLLWMVPLLFFTNTAAGSELELVDAVRDGDHRAVRALLKGDVDVNAPHRPTGRQRWPGQLTGTIWKWWDFWWMPAPI